MLFSRWSRGARQNQPGYAHYRTGPITSSTGLILKSAAEHALDKKLGPVINDGRRIDEHLANMALGACPSWRGWTRVAGMRKVFDTLRFNSLVWRRGFGR